MLFDHRLTLAAHIKELTQRCQKDLNLMKLVSGTNFGADKIILIRLYTSLIRSKIHYGCQAYGSAAKSHLKKLDTILATALRIATGAYKGTQTLKYWARSASLGSKLPINSQTESKSIYTTCKNRLNGRTPYNIKVQDLLENTTSKKSKFNNKHSLQNLI